jgi:phosphatidylinositol alpha 1,6-mannosyltransferase
VKKTTLRIAYFPCTYHEVDGIASTSRYFEAFAKHRELPFLIVHAGPSDEIREAGSVKRVQLRRSFVKLPIDRAHSYDFLFLRHLRRVEALLRDFQPDLVHITGPSDVGILGALAASTLRIPLAASWQTNLHQYARCRLAKLVSFAPKATTTRLLNVTERLSFRAIERFYRSARLLFAPNQEIIRLLKETTGKPCALMSHAVDTRVFSPEFRKRIGGPFRIGYVGRLTPEKSVRMLVRLEQALLARGHWNFLTVVIGQGREEKWLRDNLQQAEFKGVLRDTDLSRAFADMDVFAFPSESDTFGLVVLEALASGVPAVVAGTGGPKTFVQHGCTGYVAKNFGEFIAFTETLMTRSDLLFTMRTAARQQAVATSWDQTFESMYLEYQKCLGPAPDVNAISSEEAYTEQLLLTESRRL